MLPLKIYSFKPKIEVDNLAPNEVVMVRVRLEFADNVVSGSVIKSFGVSGIHWLSDDDMMQLYPSQSVIWAVLVDAQSNKPHQAPPSQ